MSKIVVLTELVTNRIAAGEVIERPASIVKELVENSIDADSTKIEIQVKAGGKDFISISDNGIGIAPDEMKLAIKRHATSKIREIDDLRTINTLGFRGEALPSIASISKTDIVSRTRDNELGQKLVISHGEIIEDTETGAPYGTTITITELFYKIPARRKFIKTANTEFSHIRDIVEKIACAYPKISFSLKHDDKVYFDLPTVNTYEQRLKDLWDSESVEDMRQFDSGDYGIAVFGFASPPNVHKSNAKRIRFVLNGRPITNKTLIAAVKRAYEGALPPGRYPEAIIFLEVDSELVDFNVHPAKLEVRFRRSDDIFRAVSHALKQIMQPDDELSEVLHNIKKKDFNTSSDKKDYSFQSKPSYPSTHKMEDYTPQMPMITEDQIYSSPEYIEKGVGEKSDQHKNPTFWQAHHTYIIAEIKGGILLIDQHAAHERILFEKIRDSLLNQPGGGQRLLFPIAIRLSPEQENSLLKFRDKLEQLGFSFGPITSGHTIIESIPGEISSFGEGETLLEMLDELSEGLKSGNAIDEFAALSACHMAIKAGDQMSQEEMGFLFDRLFACEKPYTCPHGRPTLIKIKLDELEKRFSRK